MNPYLPILAYAVALGLTAWAVQRGDDGRLKRTAWALAGGCVASIGAQLVTGKPDPWLAFLLIDAATAWVVLHRPAGRVQALIGGLLIGQVLWHAAYGYVGNIQGQHVYLAALNTGGFIQVAILFGGATYDKGRGLLAARRDRVDRQQIASHGNASVETRGKP